MATDGPTNDFCNIYSHQSAVKGGRIWIDGGTATYNASVDIDDRYIDYNTQLLSLDLETNWEATDELFMANNVMAFNKLNDRQLVPPRQLGSLFPGGSDDTNIYLLGGVSLLVRSAEVNATFFNDQPPAIWAFDTSLKQWASYSNPAGLLSIPDLPSAGSIAAAPEANLGFFINGEIASPPSLDLVDPSQDGFSLAPGMVILNTRDKNATNVTITNLTGGRTSTRGGAGWFPNLGTHGVVLRVGGMAASDPNYEEVAVPEVFVTFDVIDVLDVGDVVNRDDPTAEVVWSQQEATGQIPSPRTSFCTVTVSAQDDSSHHLYVYGGRQAGVFIDDIYVLSIPAFRWTRVYDGTGPRAHHTCHLVAGSRLLSIGGRSSVYPTTDCEANDRLGVSIFDMNEGVFRYDYSPDVEPFQVPAVIYQIIGGDATGGATVTTPSNGFSSPELEALFAPSNLTNTDNNSSGSPSSGRNNDGGGGTSTGTIVGSVVGSVLGLIIIGTFLWWFFFYRQRHAKAGAAVTEDKTVSSENNVSETAQSVHESRVGDNAASVQDHNSITPGRPLSPGVYDGTAYARRLSNVENNNTGRHDEDDDDHQGFHAF